MTLDDREIATLFAGRFLWNDVRFRPQPMACDCALLANDPTATRGQADNKPTGQAKVTFPIHDSFTALGS